MNRSSYKRRLSSLRDKLVPDFPDTMWVIQPENRRYLSGFKAPDPQINETSGSLLISRKMALLITDSRYTIEAKREARDFDVVTIKWDLIKEFPALLERLKTKVLGFEGDYLTYKLYRELVKMLKKLRSPVRLAPMDRIVEEMRAIKDQSEIRAMEASAGMMSGLLSEVISGLRPGRTEIEIARELEQLALEAGAEGMAFPSIVASGPNSALPHAVPTNRKIGRKEPIIFDVGLKFNGYCCDMTRTIFLDSPGPEFREIYRTVRNAQLSAIESVKPGTDSTKPDSVARGIIKDAGFGMYFGHSLGHGVGLATHEAPRLGPINPVKLAKGMTVTVEPGIYIPGKGGVRLEEMVVIEAKGARILTKNNCYYDF
ncbi:MAG TPA: aminopeptidase P family protein [Desulfatiglandales bacterium]|nr:aminopeptidase P family protein [Desulfatiglandales bacterium]